MQHRWLKLAAVYGLNILATMLFSAENNFVIQIACFVSIVTENKVGDDQEIIVTSHLLQYAFDGCFLLLH